MITKFLVKKFPPNHNLWFQQNGVMAHMAMISMAELHFLFLQQVISCFSDVPWPSCLPDLTEPDYFSVGLFEK
jgi:hypothetical protein